MNWGQIIANLPTILVVGGLLLLANKLGLLKKLWNLLGGAPAAAAPAVAPAPVAPIAIVIQALSWLAIAAMIVMGFVAYVDRDLLIWGVDKSIEQKDLNPDNYRESVLKDPGIDPTDKTVVANPEVRMEAMARERQAKKRFNDSLFADLCQNPSDAAWVAAKDADGNKVAAELKEVPGLRVQFCNPGARIAEVAKGLGLTGALTPTINISGTITGTLPAVESWLGTPSGTPPAEADNWVK